MFAINRLFSRNTDPDPEDQYVKVASLIEEGSILDRRKITKERRTHIERRIRLRDAFAGINLRSGEDRRGAKGRREREEGLSQSVSSNGAHDEVSDQHELINEATNLNPVDVLVRDQTQILDSINELTAKAKANEFEGLQEIIRDISFKVKNITVEEEKLLYLSFDKKHLSKSGKADKTLADILVYIHDVSDQVLEYLERYHYSGVTEANVGFFLLDMNIVYKALKHLLNKKKEHLYTIYE